MGGGFVVYASYLFPSQTKLDEYFNGNAIAGLRAEGKTLFVDTSKVAFERKILTQEFHI